MAGFNDRRPNRDEQREERRREAARHTGLMKAAFGRETDEMCIRDRPKTIIDEVRISSKFSAAGAWTIMIKYIAPVLVIIILVAYVAAQFGFFSM